MRCYKLLADAFSVTLQRGGPGDELCPVDADEPRVRLVHEEAGGGDGPRLVGAAKVSAVVDGGPELVGQVMVYWL